MFALLYSLCGQASIVWPLQLRTRNLASNILEVLARGCRTTARARGPLTCLQQLTLHFSYEEEFKMLPEAYQTLILDILRGDQTLFTRSDEVDRVWQVLIAFGAFGFCKAHAAAFAIPVYQSAWLKRHHPAAFYAGVLAHDPGMYPKRVILQDARLAGVRVLGPDINASATDWIRTTGVSRPHRR